MALARSIRTALPPPGNPLLAVPARTSLEAENEGLAAKLKAMRGQP